MLHTFTWELVNTEKVVFILHYFIKMVRSLLLNQQPAKTPNKYFWNARPLFERYSQKP